MKSKLTILFATLFLCLWAVCANAQTTTPNGKAQETNTKVYGGKCNIVDALNIESWYEWPKNYSGYVQVCKDSCVRMAGNIKNGKIDGLFKRWHSNGQLFMETEYKGGQLNGASTLYYKNGQLKCKEIFKDDLPIDQESIYYDETGKVKGKRISKEFVWSECEGDCN